MASSHGVPRFVKEGDVDKERENIHEYRSLLELVTAKIKEKEFTAEVLGLTSKLLKKNPEYYTIWNFRRLILVHQFSCTTTTPTNSAVVSDAPIIETVKEAIVNDLKFIVPLLIQYPKCYWIWKYRLWLLEQAEKHLPQTVTRQLWGEELGLVGKMLTRDERNFHGWSYRRHIVGQLERLRQPEEGSLVEQEFAYTSKMIKAALQNFSALHYRSKLLPRLLDERQADGTTRRKMLQDELDNMQEALIDPFNQSAWFYHQYLMSTLSVDCPKEAAIVQDLTTADCLQFYEQELERISEITEDFDDCKWVFEALVQYTIEYSQLKGVPPSTQADIGKWLEKLGQLDPMRSGRWDDMRSSLKL